jgi:hypothetical protein
MIPIGLVLVLVAAALGADIVLENVGKTDVVVIGQTLSFDIWALFALGAAVGVTALAGVQLIARGLVRGSRRRTERRGLVRAIVAEKSRSSAAPVSDTSPVPEAVPARPVEAPGVNEPAHARPAESTRRRVIRRATGLRRRDRSKDVTPTA